MTKEEAKEYANNMTYREAVSNAMVGRCVPFRKATAMKLHELLSLADSFDKIISEIDIARYIDKDKRQWKNINASGLELALVIINKHRKEQINE